MFGVKLPAPSNPGKPAAMIVEMRTYTLQIGKVPEYFKLYEAEGMAVQTRHLPRMLGYYQTEMGTLNQIIHMWGYDSFEQRLECRARMQADPAWQAYLAKVRPMVVTQETKLLLPAPFFKP
jgi:hypothetical protein